MCISKCVLQVSLHHFQYKKKVWTGEVLNIPRSNFCTHELYRAKHNFFWGRSCMSPHPLQSLTNWGGGCILKRTIFTHKKKKKLTFSSVDKESNHFTVLQSTLPKSNSHKSNNRLSRRSIQVLFSLYSIVFNPS